MTNNEKLENKELEQVNGGYDLPADQFMLIFGCEQAAPAQPNAPASGLEAVVRQGIDAGFIVQE